MKVLEELTAKALQTGQKISDKVKDVNDTVGLNNEIAQHEAEILNLYAFVGQLIIDQEHLKNFSDISDLGLQAKLKDFSDEIAEKKMQLSVLLDKRCQKTGKGRCKTCGAEISCNDIYCAKCGTRTSILQGVEL